MDKNSYPFGSIIFFRTDESDKSYYVGHIISNHGIITMSYGFDYLIAVNAYDDDVCMSTNKDITSNKFVYHRFANREERQLLYSEIGKYLESKAAAICNKEQTRETTLTEVDAICKKLNLTRADIIRILQNETPEEDGDDDGEEV